MSENHDDGAPRLSGMWVGLAEALIWIVLRDAEAARSMRDAPKRVYTAVALHVAVPGRQRLSDFHDAKSGLLDRLRHGDIAAQGITGTLHHAEGQRQPIDASDWANLRFYDGDQSFIARSVDGAMSLQFWHDVIVQADQLAKAFPTPQAQLDQHAATGDLAAPKGTCITQVPSEPLFRAGTQASRVCHLIAEAFPNGIGHATNDTIRDAIKHKYAGKDRDIGPHTVTRAINAVRAAEAT